VVKMVKYKRLSSGDIYRLIALGKTGIGRPPEYWRNYARVQGIDMNVVTPPTAATTGTFIVQEGARKGERGSLEQLYLENQEIDLEADKPESTKQIRGEIGKAIHIPVVMVAVAIGVLGYFLLANVRKG